MPRFKLALALGAFALCGASASFGAVVYTQTSTTGLTTSTATLPTALDDINFAAGSTATRQELSALTFGYGVLPGTAAQTAAVFLDFYDTVNMASTGVVESSYLGGFGGTLNITANTGTTTTLRASSFSSLTTLTTPVFFTDDNIGVVITFTDSTGANYSSILTPLFSVPGTPTVGTSVTGAYRDTSGDGDFQASEFNAAQGNLYLSITTIAAPVPEPSSIALAGMGGFALLVGTFRLRRRQA